MNGPQYNYELIYKARKGGYRTDSRSNLQIQFENMARAEANKLHDKYLAFLEKALGHKDFEVTNVSCLADGIIGHVYVGKAPKGTGQRKCCFCGCDDFDGF